MQIRKITNRREFLRLTAIGAASAAILAACAPAAVPTDTPAPAPAAPTAAPKPTEAPKPAAAAPTATTAAAAPTAAPKPTEAPKPTAAATAAPKPAAGVPVPALLRAGSGEENFFNEVLDLFESKNPGVKTNRIFVTNESSEYTTKLDLMIASGDPPAIYAPFGDRGFHYYAAKGLSQEIGSFVARDKVDLSDFHQGSLKGSHWKGQLMALPLDLWAFVTYYNRNLFKAAGVDAIPTDWTDKTWDIDKYQEVAGKLSKQEGGKTVQFGSTVYEKGYAAGSIFGGDWWPEDSYDNGVIREFTGDTDPRVAAAVQWSGDMQNKLHYSPSPSQGQELQVGAPALFMSGKVGMQVTAIGSLEQFSKITAFDWGVGAVPCPPKGEPRRVRIWVDYWAMIKGVKNLEGAWQLLKFMSSAEAQSIYPLKYGPLPALYSLGPAWSEYYRKTLPNLSAKEFQAITEAPKYEHITPDNWTVNFTEINSQVLTPGLDKVWLGTQTADDAIKAMAPKIRKIIDETKNV